MERLPGLNVANIFEKRALLIAINSLAALSIFFFGYDQGLPLCPRFRLITNIEMLTWAHSRCHGWREQCEKLY
jgi:hypothetical protein